VRYSSSTLRVVGVDTFSMDHEWSPRSRKRSRAQRSIATPFETSACVADCLAEDSAVQGVEAWTWTSFAAGGSSGSGSLSGPNVETTTLALDPTFAAQSFKGTGLLSIPKTTWTMPPSIDSEAAIAPAANPPSPVQSMLHIYYQGGGWTGTSHC